MIKILFVCHGRICLAWKSVENQGLFVFLMWFYQRFTNISGEPGLAIIIFEMKNVVRK